MGVESCDILLSVINNKKDGGEEELLRIMTTRLTGGHDFIVRMIFIIV